MARTTTLTELIAAVRSRGDWADTDFLSATEITDYLNSAIAELYTIIVGTNQDFFLTTAAITVVAATDTYPLPADFYKVRGVQVLNSEGTYERLLPFNYEEQDLYPDMDTERTFTRYRVMGSNLVLAPTPSWAGTIRLAYIAAPAKLVNGTDVFDGIAGFEEYIVTAAAIRCANKEQTSVRTWPDDLLRLEVHIRSAVATRDTSSNDRVRDVGVKSRVLLDPFKNLPRP